MEWDLFIVSYLGMFFQDIPRGAGLPCDPVGGVHSAFVRAHKDAPS